MNRIVTHKDARDAYIKLHAHVYNGGPMPLLSVPPREDDVDIVLWDYIEQQEKAGSEDK